MKNNRSGQILMVVMGIVVVMLILTPVLVNWVKKDTEWGVKQQKNTTAFNLAVGAVERGTWKLKSSTTTWVAATAGVTVASYDFGTTFRDLEGGSYRIKFTAGPSTNQVTVTAEARDADSRETRALQAVYQNDAISGPVLASGNIDLSDALEPHWGPIMAQGNINLSGAAASNYFPRKFSKNVVQGTAANPRDVNGISPPNTDNLEWWSGYPVPDLPALDFTTLRASAAANGTLNYYNGFTSSHTFTGYSGSGHSCNVAGTSTAHPNPHNTHFADSTHHPLALKNLIWYWDGDVSFTGGADLSGHSNGLYGTIIVRGNMTIETEDNLSYTATLSTTVWKDYQKIDTAASNEYPGDTGYHQNATTFGLGTQNWTTGPASAAYTDVGFRGFVYVGKNFTIASGAKSDYAGALWVVGNVTNANAGEHSYVFFDKTVANNLPVLNVVLVQQSWNEVTPSATAWAP